MTVVNAHTHLYSGLAPLGMPEPSLAPASFLEILERKWWRLDRALDEESLRAAARLYVAEARLSGTGALVDHHESPELIEGSLDVLANACHELGMTAVLCYGATERNRGREEARRGLEECRRFIRSNNRTGIRGIVGIHASFTVSDDTLRDAGDLCRELGVPLHIHLAEDFVDVEDARRRGYAGPLERLEALGALVSGSILAHGVHLGPKQVRRACELGCWLVQNPRSNEGNGVGYPRALYESSRVALGTDGYPSDMKLEAMAQVDAARKAGVGERELAELDQRAARGAALVAEVFEGGCEAEPRTDTGGGPLLPAALEQIRDEAREHAARLWERMERL